ncbi:hypothetical protein V1T75_01685 [Tenacibaculum sp. FZY0031]|uniref:hypothetical protein n=1 Tax=Tenacibaculum TaxID=104267 RepID=UPI000F5B4D35|nr:MULTISPECIES: hypothetical protein [Tenacibaculum]MEE3999031.1 hypothetical protein [Tenacibaculum sp. FZY0031]NVK08649.1 hypothetical protein [Tenacibaculum sp.]
MNKIIKIFLIIAGIILIGYGIYKIISPEATVDIGIAEFNSQNNNNAYITLGIGIATLMVSFFIKKQ